MRAHPLVFGVVFFLASELMFFAGLFAAYFDLRGQNAARPPRGVQLDLIESTAGTLVLAASSIAMFVMTCALSRRDIAAARAWLGSAIALGDRPAWMESERLAH